MGRICARFGTKKNQPANISISDRTLSNHVTHNKTLAARGTDMKKGVLIRQKAFVTKSGEIVSLCKVVRAFEETSASRNK